MRSALYSRLKAGSAAAFGLLALTLAQGAHAQAKCYAVTSSPGKKVSQRIDCTTGKPINEDSLTHRLNPEREAGPNGPTVPMKTLNKATDFASCTVGNEAALCLKANR